MKNIQKKSKKKLRGMTLVEIIIALAVFAMLGALLVLAALSIEKHSRAARKINDKVAVQGPIAESQNKAGSVVLEDNFEITVNGNIKIEATLYDTANYIEDASGNLVRATDHPESEDLNFKYIADIQMPTQAPTTP